MPLFFLQGIAKRLVRAALEEAAKKKEMKYNDLKRLEKGIRRHFHDDITVIVIYLDHHHQETPISTSMDTNGTFECTSVPVDIFSFNAD